MIAATDNSSAYSVQGANVLEGSLNQGSPNHNIAVGYMLNNTLDVVALPNEGTVSAIINGTLYDNLYGSPSSAFPFARLAFIATNTTTYYYHQVNESMVLEELAATNGGGGGTKNNAWGTPTTIVIPTK